MEIEERYEDVWKKARGKLSTSSHGVSHTERVYRLAKEISDDDVDRDVLFPSALLHDIARVKEDEDETGEIDHAILGGGDGRGCFEKGRLRRRKDRKDKALYRDAQVQI